LYEKVKQSTFHTSWSKARKICSLPQFQQPIVYRFQLPPEDEILVPSHSVGVKTERSNTFRLPYVFMCTFGCIPSVKAVRPCASVSYSVP